MTISITFGGASIRRPGAYAIVDTANMVPVSLGALRALAIIGVLDESATLEAGRAYAFNQPSEAAKALKQGDVLNCMNIAWQHGADLIYVSRVDKATKAEITLKNSNNADALRVVAKVAGTSGNGITVAVDATNLIVSDGTVDEKYAIESKPIQQIADEINKASQFVSCVVLDGTESLAMTAETNLSGGGAGPAPSDADWQDAIDVLEEVFVDGIIPITTSEAIMAKVDTHVQAMSNTNNRRRRRAFYGHDVGASIETIKALASTLNSERALLASPCPLVADSSGNKVAKPSYYTAAAIAGIWAGQEPQEPVTYKFVKFSGLERQYKANEIVELLDAHVCVVEVVKNAGYRIVQGITTSSSSDLTKSELSVSTLKDVMSADLENHFESKYVGKAGVPGIEVTIYNDLISKIESYKAANWISGYVPESVKVTKNGTAFYLDWEGKPTLPINNFLITTHLSL